MEEIMQLSIRYWGMWNYLPQASRLEASIKEKHPSAEVTLIEGSGGEFEVTFNGDLIFSKKELERFPEDEEILTKI